jgi:DNA-directed RNA polymerase specialized sigma24 family protein
MGYEDAAQKLGIGKGTVRARLSRARAALRRNPRIRRLA